MQMERIVTENIHEVVAQTVVRVVKIRIQPKQYWGMFNVHCTNLDSFDSRSSKRIHSSIKHEDAEWYQPCITAGLARARRCLGCTDKRNMLRSHS